MPGPHGLPDYEPTGTASSVNSQVPRKRPSYCDADRESLQSSIIEVALPPPDSIRYFADDRLRFHSVDQILEFAHARVLAALKAPWRDGAEIPPVGVGTECEYIVAVFRARAGKTYTFACSYLNALRVDSLDGSTCPQCDGKCEDEGTCPLTGWFQLTGDGDFDSGCYRPLSLYEGDKLRAWRELPKYIEPTR